MTTQTIVNLADLSADQIALLQADLIAKQKEAKERRANDIEALKTMQDDFVAEWIFSLIDFSSKQSSLVDAVLLDTKPLIDLKAQIYNTSDKQDSHTFTHRNGWCSIRVGYNVVIGYDGTADAGIQMIKKYLSSLAEDSEVYTKISKVLNVLMKPDKNGNLNPARATELSNLKAEIADDLFSEGVDTVISAQFKSRTSTYISGWLLKNLDNGKEIKVQFRITA